LIVVPDEWGLTTSILDQASRFASSGFLVLAVDLYRGVVATDPGQAARLSRKLTDREALNDLKAAITFVRAQPNVRAGHIGVVAWSSGGLYALELGATEADLAAIAITGSLPTKQKQPPKGLKSAVLLNIAGGDPAFSAARLREFEAGGRALGLQID